MRKTYRRNSHRSTKKRRTQGRTTGAGGFPSKATDIQAAAAIVGAAAAGAVYAYLTGVGPGPHREPKFLKEMTPAQSLAFQEYLMKRRNERKRANNNSNNNTNNNSNNNNSNND
jgi:hypothetical protein